MHVNMSFTIGEIINMTILGFTAITVFFYTRAAQKSNEIQERPILNLYLRGTPTGDFFNVRNVGNGSAYNIKLSGIKAGDWIYKPYFSGANPILEGGGDEKSLKVMVKSIDGLKTQGIVLHQILNFFRDDYLQLQRLVMNTK